VAPAERPSENPHKSRNVEGRTRTGIGWSTLRTWGALPRQLYDMNGSTPLEFDVIIGADGPQ
jgi:hypothetical protein